MEQHHGGDRGTPRTHPNPARRTGQIASAQEHPVGQTTILKGNIMPTTIFTTWGGAVEVIVDWIYIPGEPMTEDCPGERPDYEFRSITVNSVPIRFRDLSDDEAKLIDSAITEDMPTPEDMKAARRCRRLGGHDEDL